uniref:lysozyme n=1 Tax=Glossina austeni TaxID=7395 RepID=A0A1A9VFF1_GLOAU
MQTNVDTTSDTKGKIYSECELAQELYRKHHIPMEQIPIWVCIVQHESGFNTSAITRLNADGSADHGLFQISDLYWCSHDRNGGKACNISCDDLLDSDISDDVRCVKTIYEDHARISGDGFTAWSVYKPHCLNRSLRGTWSCFSHQNVDEIKIEINLSIKGTRIPELCEQVRASQNVSSNNSVLYYETNVFLNPRREEFLKGSIKLEFKKNDNQLYISNPFVNDNSTNNNPEHTLMDSSSTLSTSPPVLLGNLSAITTISPYDTGADCPFEALTTVAVATFIVFNNAEQIEPSQISLSEGRNSAPLLADLTKTSSKTFERCEFANILRYYYNLDLDEVAQWVCIAHEASGLNSSLRSLDSHGLFQINEQSWCSPPGTGCNVECDKLRDDHITDDLACVKVIHAEHQRKSGDGYTAWPAYQRSCRNQSFAYIENCFGNQLTGQYQGYTTRNYSRNEKSKIYGRCELARELYEEHNIPIEQVATWICIAQHESHFNTSAVGHRDGDGSIAYGLFQISNLRRCSNKRYGLNRLIDDNITDDVECIKRIYKEHAALFGGGFTAWTAYLPYCRNQHYEHIASCFEKEESNDISYKRSASSLHLQYIDNPFFKQKKTLVPGNDVFQVKEKDVILETKVYAQCSLAQELYFKHNIPIHDVATWICIAQHASHFNTSKIGPMGDDDSKSYGLFQINDRYWCSRYSYEGKGCNVPCANLLDSDISDDIRCVRTIYQEHTRISAQHESSFNTAAIGRLNADGSADHGLFQISDLYWCSHDRKGGKACSIPCEKLLDADISDDVRCIKIIYDQHTRISGDGFTAWTVYKPYCRKRPLHEIVSCFSSQKVDKIEKSIYSTNDVRKPKLYEQFSTSQDVNIKNLHSSYKSNLFLNGLKTFSSTNKPALTWNSSTTLISRHIIASTIKPNLTDINKATTEIMKISLPATIAQAKPIKDTTIWQSDKKDSLRNVDIYEQLSKISRIVTSTSKIPSTTARPTILTKYTNTVISTITTKQHITKQSTSKAKNFMESSVTPFAETKEKKSKTIVTDTNGKSSIQGKAEEKTTSSNYKTSSRIIDWSETAAEKPPTQKPVPTNVTSATRATKWNIITTKRPESTWLTSKKPNALGHITGRRVSSVMNSSTTQNPIGKSIKSNKLLLSYDWASYMKAFNIPNAIATTKQPVATRTSYNFHARRAYTTKLLRKIK